MNKRKTTSIALAAAVAISTVQLAYPANVFAETTASNNKSINLKKSNYSNENYDRKSITPKENNTLEIKSFKTGKLSEAISKASSDISTITNLKVSGGVLNDNDLYYIRDNMKELVEIDLSETTCVNNKIPNQAIGIKDSDAGNGNKNENLKIFKFPQNVKEVGVDAFNACVNLNNFGYGEGNLKLPESIEKIDATAFARLKGFKSIELPSNLKEVGGWCFAYCDNLEGEIIIPGRLVKIGNAMFESTSGKENKITSVIIEEGVTEIGMFAFRNRSSLETIKFPSTLKVIGKEVFSGTNLIDIGLNEGLETIGYVAFGEKDANGKIIKIPSTLKSYDNSITGKTILDFTNCSSFESLKSITGNAVLLFSDDKVIPTESMTSPKLCTDGGKLKDNATYENGKLPNPYKEGYVFCGWYEKDQSNNFEGESVTTVDPTKDKNKTYYAKWAKVNDYTIVYGQNETTIALRKEGETVNNVTINDYKVDSKYSDIISVDNNGKITTKGVGTAYVSYSVKVGEGEAETVTSKVEVTKPSGTVATIGKVPYTDLKTAIEAAEGKTIEVETKENGDAIKIELNSNLVINKPMTINFNGATLSKKATESKPSTKTSDDKCLIKITSEGVIIQNANFDLSNGEEVAILVDGTNNNASNVTLGGTVNATRKSITTSGKEEKAPVVKMVGGDSGVTIKENTKVNGTSSPSNGNSDKDIIVDTASGASADKITNNNNSSGGGNYIPSKPTYTHEKIEGLDRYETAAKIADKLGSYDNVVLVNAESSMSDGLAASGLAGKENGAILLTKKDSIPKATMDRIKKVKKVYIIGGEAAISKKVSDEITKNVPNVKVERLGGKTRVETSEIVAKKLGNYNKAFVVNGFKGEADAMSASSVAAKNGAPILLTNGKTSTHAKKSGVEYYVIGGDTVVDKSIATKYDAEVLAGKDRYATNKEVIDEFYSGRDKIYFANGETLVDALTASTLAKKDGIALVNAKSDKSVLKGKDTVQVGGMKFTIDFDK